MTPAEHAQRMHRTAAYGALCNTAETLRVMLANAQSQQHPLALSDRAVAAVYAAMKALHDAQREMETPTKCGICGKQATAAAGPANEPICTACEAEMMVQL